MAEPRLGVGIPVISMARHGSVWLKFRQFDAYAKTLDDFRVKSTAGAAATVFSALVIVILIMSELFAYRTPTWTPSLVVDKGRKEKMAIHFDITFPRMPCHMLSLDIMDDSGEHITGYSHDVLKTRLDMMGVSIDTEKEFKLGDTSHGAEKALLPADNCGSCYGAVSQREDGCCNTCNDVREAYVNMGWGMIEAEKIEQCQRENWKELFEKHSNEGCNLNGRLLVNKVRGNFHIAPGQAFSSGNMHIHDLKTFISGAPDGHKFDLSHHIHLLKFGPDGSDTHKSALAVTNPLGGTDKQTSAVRTTFQYFLKIVATELISLNGEAVYTNQYSATMNERELEDNMHGLPGVFFIMDISPMLIIYRESRASFTSLITGIVAIVGGIITVSGLLVRVMNRAERSLKHKH